MGATRGTAGRSAVTVGNGAGRKFSRLVSSLLMISERICIWIVLLFALIGRENSTDGDNKQF